MYPLLHTYVNCENTRHRQLSLFTWFWLKRSINLMLWFWETNLTKEDFWEPIDCESFMENCYMLCEDDWWCNYVTTSCCVILMIFGDCIYVKLVVTCWWLHIYKYWWWWGDYCLCEHMHWVKSYVHAFMTDGGGFYIQLRWVRCFCCIEGDDLEVFWNHMHLEKSLEHCMHLNNWWVVS